MDEKRAENRFKRRIRAGEPAVAMWMHTPSLATLRSAAGHGIDAVFLDMEHTSLQLRDVQELSLVARLLEVTTLVRPPTLDSESIGRLLDCGAEGIIFPQVLDGETAARARRRLAFPPAGTRGWGGAVTREAAGAFASRREYSGRAGAGLASIFLVESPDAVERIDEILEAGSPDGVAFGWSDYATEVDFDVDRSAAAAAAVHDACRARGIGVALYPGPHHGLKGPAAEYPWYPGCFMIAGSDSEWLAGAMERGIAEARRAAGA